MVTLLAAAALAAGLPATTPAPPSEPAIFVVRDDDTTVYLFGTFHALDGDPNWFDRGVRDAFEQSDELVLETLLPEGPGPVSVGRPDLPVRASSVTPSASFLASTRMAIDAGQSKGMRVDRGADVVLRHTAEAEGKQVEGLETLEFQINMFNRMPPAAPPKRTVLPKPGDPVGEMPMQSLSREMTAMQSAWKRGDQSIFVRMLHELENASPETYQMMFTDRNARWADWIKARMQTPGTVFVAVGAGHLAGKDSVLVRLAEKGVPSQRVY